MNRKYIFVSIFAFVFSFFFLTFGFCAFTSDLTINDVGVTVRQPLDVRVTNVTLNNSTGGASVENLDYNVRSVMSDITLPENSSNVVPITSYPFCCSSNADTLLSTPPLIPNNTFLFSIIFYPSHKQGESLLP